MRRHKSDIAFSATQLSLVRRRPCECKLAQFPITRFCPTVQCRQHFLTITNIQFCSYCQMLFQTDGFLLKLRFGNVGGYLIKTFAKLKLYFLKQVLSYFIVFGHVLGLKGCIFFLSPVFCHKELGALQATSNLRESTGCVCFLYFQASLTLQPARRTS